MKKVSPMNDLMFKKIFGSPSNSYILKCFIVDVLGLNVTKVTILNPYNIRTFREARKKHQLIETEVDILAQVDDEALITIEMQVAKEAFFAERSLHYACEKYVSNYAKDLLKEDNKSKYSTLRPVYGINILNFNLFEDEDVIHVFDLYDREHEKYLLNVAGQPLMKVLYLELKKAKGKRKRALKYWIKFFLEGKVDEDAPEYIKEACKLLDYENLDQEERNMMDALERGRADLEAQFEYVEERGIKRGKVEGKLEAAQKMLSEDLDIELIQRITGLSFEEIKRLK